MRTILVAVLGAAVAFQAAADDGKSKARTLLEDHRDAVVTVALTITTTASFGGIGGQGEESRSEVVGTVVRPDGLTVVSLSETDPMALLSNMMPGEFSDMFAGNSEVTSAAIIVGREQEVTAEIVLRDQDLDLAFIRPVEPREEPFVHIDLDQAAAAEILDDVVAIGRLGRIANRVHTVGIDAVSAVVERPRRFYILGSGGSGQGSLGSPVFTLDGAPLGVFVMRTLPGMSQGSGMGLGSLMGMQDNVLAIVLPAEEIRESALQAPGFDDEDDTEDDGGEDAE